MALHTLSESEANATNDAIAILSSLPWAKPLLQNVNNRGGLTSANMPLLLEVRFARALHDAGKKPDYEQQGGEGNSRVDFTFGSDPSWLVEIFSLGETKAAEAATWSNGKGFGRTLASPSATQARTESEEGETLLAIQRIVGKISDGERPSKFPPPQDNRFAMLVVDMRTFLHGGDRGDYEQIAYGAAAVPPSTQRTWPRENGTRVPMIGAFDPSNPMRGAAHFRKRVHFIAFIAERSYCSGEIAEGMRYAPNWALFGNEDKAKAALRSFPLCLIL